MRIWRICSLPPCLCTLCYCGKRERVVKRCMLTSLKQSRRLIHPRITDIKITLGGHNVIYLPHQLMQHKSIFAQTGRATYITLMTMQSQGGTTNETKCNYCPPPIWKQTKPSCTPIWGSEHRDENKPSSRHHSALQWAFLLILRSVFRLFSMIPISWWLSRHSLPDIHEVIRKQRITGGVELLAF